MPRTSSKANRQRGAQYLLASGIAGGLGGDEAGAALRSMLLGSMALGNLYLQRLMLDPLDGKDAPAAIPAGFQKISTSLLALARTLNAVPGDPATAGQVRPFEELSTRLAEAAEKIEVNASRGEEDDDWASVTELERELFARAGLTEEDPDENGH